MTEPALSDTAAAARSTSTGIERIAQAFAGTRRRAAVMPYLMAGFPTLEQSRQIGLAYADAGADIIELGVPYSDPLADGPVIHEAATQALAGGVTLDGVLDVARTLAERLPVVLMCYANMVFAPGVQSFVERLAEAGVSGLIVPDLPLEEADATREQCDRVGIALVPLLAPTSTPERMARIGDRARGFLYTVSVVGTTGERAALSDRFAEVVAAAKACTAVPVALGFGISTAEHVRQAVDAGADGVIIGTRLVRAAADAKEPAAAVGELLVTLASGMDADR